MLVFIFLCSSIVPQSELSSRTSAINLLLLMQKIDSTCQEYAYRITLVPGNGQPPGRPRVF